MAETTTSHRGVTVKETMKVSTLRRMMAKSMQESVQRAALSQVTREMDLSAVQAARQAAGEGRHSLNTYVLAAVAHTLPQHPLLNAELVENNVVVFGTVNLGIAIAVPDGLVVAVIPAAESKSLDELAAATTDLASRARAGKLRMPDIEGGTFTVSNLGMYGVDGGFPLPRPPEGAILLVGRVQTKPAWIDGAVVPRDYAWITLTFDHRFIDGATAAAFLQSLQTQLLSW
jgi:pyruvate dehydrogenase E2 component (dihydrolipoamide acetyltransferase)